METGLAYVVAGLTLAATVLLPPLLAGRAVSAPLLLLGFGMLLGLSPLPDMLGVVEPSETLVLHVTELAVLVALMGVGLALDRGLDPRSRRSWRAWSTTWRLLAVTMPLTIAAVALLGWWVGGLVPATAIALGAVLAPTDPVLASEVQVGGPSASDDPDDLGEPDELRFALTSEAGLNDGLAFPFVHLALLVASGSLGALGWVEWVGWYLVGKVVLGVLVGVAAGWVVVRLAFDSRDSRLRVAERGQPMVALVAVFTSYGLAEVVGGYGFLAVFACGMTIRSRERSHEYHGRMHAMVERLEDLLTLVILLALGVALARGLLDALEWSGVLVGVALVFVIRPVASWLALGFRPGSPARDGSLTNGQRAGVAFFGVRGIGSLFYVAYVVTHADLAHEAWLWSTVGFTVALSVLVHGVTAGPVLRRLDEDRAAASA